MPPQFHKMFKLMHLKGPQSALQMEAALALLVQGVRVVTPVQFIVKVNTQVFVICNHLYVQTLDVH